MLWHRGRNLFVTEIRNVGACGQGGSEALLLSIPPAWGSCGKLISVIMWLLPQLPRVAPRSPNGDKMFYWCWELLFLVSRTSEWSIPSPVSSCCSFLRLLLENGAWVSGSSRTADCSPACSLEEFWSRVLLQYILPFLSLFGEHKDFKTGGSFNFKEFLPSALQG